jgi:hypothetical protein
VLINVGNFGEAVVDLELEAFLIDVLEASHSGSFMACQKVLGTDGSLAVTVSVKCCVSTDERDYT